MADIIVSRNLLTLLLAILFGLVLNKEIIMEDQDEHTSTTCENEMVNLKCSLYHGLKIMDAFWGRKSKKKCPTTISILRNSSPSRKQENKTDTVLCTKGINQEGILWRVQQICESMGTCAVPASSAFFGIEDPCPNVYKYMELTVKCRKYDLETWVGDNVYY